jgi:transcriptional regulator with XRE-family HTH domain
MTTSDTNRRVGDAIRVRRQSRRMTLADLHEATGIDVSQLSRIERGIGGTSAEQQERIASALGWATVDLWKFASRHARTVARRVSSV